MTPIIAPWLFVIWWIGFALSLHRRTFRIGVGLGFFTFGAAILLVLIDVIV